MTNQNIQLSGERDRLDKVLTTYLKTSRSQVQQLINQQKISVNGNFVKANYQTTGQEVIEVMETVTTKSAQILPQKLPLDIVYEDEYLLIVNKEAGRVVHPSKGHSDHTLVNGLVHYLNTQIADGTDGTRPGIVHRLDKDTSGLLLVAKSNQIHQQLAQQIAAKKIVRKYVALVHGQVPHSQGIIEVPIGRDPANRLRFLGIVSGKPAKSTFKVLKNYDQATLVEVEIHTGRTHQIRVHLEHIGHPIIGDSTYRQGVTGQALKMPHTDSGQHLHAYYLEFQHPVTQERLQIEAKPPIKFLKLQAWLKTKP